MAHSIYQVDLGATAKLKGISNQNISASLERSLFQGGGTQYAFNVTTLKADIRAQISSFDLKTAIDEIGILPLDLAVDPISLYSRKLVSGGSYSTGASHYKDTLSNGIAVIDNISASQGSDATISLSAIPVSDGINSPIVGADSQNVPTLVRETERYTLGPCKIGATWFPLQSMDLAINPDFEVFGDDGYVFPTHASMTMIKPEFKLKTNDLSQLRAYALEGQAGAGAADLVIFLKKCLPGGGRVPSGTAEHIKMTIKEYQLAVDGMGGGIGLSEGTLTVIPVFDGTNAIIAFDTASEIA